MSKKLTLEDLQSINFDEGELVKDRSGYRNYSKRIALIIGYLLGVKEEYLEEIPNEPEEYYELKDLLTKNESARIIRHLNNIRSNLILRFKTVSRTIRVTASNYTPIYNIEWFKDDFAVLNKFEINIISNKGDLNEYLKNINEEIIKRIDNVKQFFPDWVDFKHIRTAFIMPMENVKTECEKYQNNQGFYPYKRYFNWKNPTELGNILLSDEKILDVLYYNNGAYFTDSDRVIDVSEKVKGNINDFIERGRKVQIFIDGENTDPYRFVAAIDSLSDEEIEKIEKITVYFDAKYTTRAWEMLKHFIGDIDIDAVAVERLLDEKSLVDHKLVAGVSKAVYQESVDSIILCSSDSDFWSVIQDVSANYLVMVETDKCGYDFKEVLRQHDIFYCYLDRFQTPSDNLFFKLVFRKELQRQIDESINSLQIDGNKLFAKALEESRAYISKQEKENIYNKYIKGLQLNISKDGIITVEVPE